MGEEETRGVGAGVAAATPPQATPHVQPIHSLNQHDIDELKRNHPDDVLTSDWDHIPQIPSRGQNKVPEDVSTIHIMNDLLIEREEKLRAMNSAIHAVQKEAMEHKENATRWRQMTSNHDIEMKYKDEIISGLTSTMESKEAALRDLSDKLSKCEEDLKAREDDVVTLLKGIQAVRKAKTALDAKVSDHNDDQDKRGFFCLRPCSVDIPTFEHMQAERAEASRIVGELDERMRNLEALLHLKKQQEQHVTARQPGKKRYDDLVKDIALKDNEIDNLKMELENAKEQIEMTHTLSHHLSQKLREVDALKENIVDTEWEVRGRDFEAESLRDLVRRLEGEILRRDQTIEDLNLQIKGLKKELLAEEIQNTMNAHQKEIYDLKVALSNAEGSLRERERENAYLQQQLSASEVLYDEKEKELNQLSASLRQLRKEQSTHQVQLDAHVGQKYSIYSPWDTVE